MVLRTQLRALWERATPDGSFFYLLPAERLAQVIKFCVVGGVGLFVDMAVLYVLADPAFLALNVTFSKISAASTAMTSNFVWNEVWTFKQCRAVGESRE